MNNINNKEKQYAGGNWSANKTIKKKTEINDPLCNEVPKHSPSKKYKKKRQRKPFYSCPFCEEDLNWKVVLTPVKINNQYFSSHNTVYDTTCTICGAKEVKECPCCKRETFFKNNIYKHIKNRSACSFIGEKKND